MSIKIGRDNFGDLTKNMQAPQKILDDGIDPQGIFSDIVSGKGQGQFDFLSGGVYKDLTRVFEDRMKSPTITPEARQRYIDRFRGALSCGKKNLVNKKGNEAFERAAAALHTAAEEHEKAKNVPPVAVLAASPKSTNLPVSAAQPHPSWASSKPTSLPASPAQLDPSSARARHPSLSVSSNSLHASPLSSDVDSESPPVSRSPSPVSQSGPSYKLPTGGDTVAERMLFGNVVEFLNRHLNHAPTSVERAARTEVLVNGKVLAEVVRLFEEHLALCGNQSEEASFLIVKFQECLHAVASLGSEDENQKKALDKGMALLRGAVTKITSKRSSAALNADAFNPLPLPGSSSFISSSRRTFIESAVFSDEDRLKAIFGSGVHEGIVVTPTKLDEYVEAEKIRLCNGGDFSVVIKIFDKAITAAGRLRNKEEEVARIDLYQKKFEELAGARAEYLSMSKIRWTANPLVLLWRAIRWCCVNIAYASGDEYEKYERADRRATQLRDLAQQLNAYGACGENFAASVAAVEPQRQALVAGFKAIEEQQRLSGLVVPAKK